MVLIDVTWWHGLSWQSFVSFFISQSSLSFVILSLIPQPHSREHGDHSVVWTGQSPTILMPIGFGLYAETDFSQGFTENPEFWILTSLENRFLPFIIWVVVSWIIRANPNWTTTIVFTIAFRDSGFPDFFWTWVTAGFWTFQCYLHGMYRGWRIRLKLLPLEVVYWNMLDNNQYLHWHKHKYICNHLHLVWIHHHFHT